MIGHSLGGKILLELASGRHPAAAEEFLARAGGGGGGQPGSAGAAAGEEALRLFVVDSAPGAKRAPRTLDDAARAAAAAAADPESVERVLELVKSMPLPIASRRAVSDAFRAAGLSQTVSTWMASNVVAEAPKWALGSSPRSAHVQQQPAKPAGGGGGGGASQPAQPHPQGAAHAHAHAHSHAHAHAHTHTPGHAAAAAGVVPPEPSLWWSFDPAAAASLYASHMSTDAWPVLIDGPPAGFRIDLVTATRSTRWNSESARAKLAELEANDAAAFPPGAGAGAGAAGAARGRSPDGSRRGRVVRHPIEAGHWVHVDNPRGLLSILDPFFGGGGGGGSGGGGGGGGGAA
jgi:hypothetical protein